MARLFITPREIDLISDITKEIHNPHYYDYIKKNGTLNRNVDDVVCGGLIYYNTMYYNIITKIYSISKITKFNSIVFLI